MPHFSQSMNHPAPGAWPQSDLNLNYEQNHSTSAVSRALSSYTAKNTNTETSPRVQCLHATPNCICQGRKVLLSATGPITQPMPHQSNQPLPELRLPSPERPKYVELVNEIQAARMRLGGEALACSAAGPPLSRSSLGASLGPSEEEMAHAAQAAWYMAESTKSGFRGRWDEDWDRRVQDWSSQRLQQEANVLDAHYWIPKEYEERGRTLVRKNGKAPVQGDVHRQKASLTSAAIGESADLRKKSVRSSIGQDGKGPNEGFDSSRVVFADRKVRRGDSSILREGKESVSAPVKTRGLIDGHKEQVSILMKSAEDLLAQMVEEEEGRKNTDNEKRNGNAVRCKLSTEEEDYVLVDEDFGVL